MRPLASLLPFASAEAAIRDALPPLARSESAALLDAVGRALAADIHAPFDVPGFDRSAMDGYALRTADTLRARPDAPARLRLAGALHAGNAAGSELRAGECVQIATGAPVPHAADAVVMVEHTRRDGDQILIERPLRPRENISPRGGDLPAGATILQAGTVLAPPRLAVLAALGLGSVAVHDRPRVGLIATGTELRSPGQDLSPGLIYDSNTPTLEAILRQHHARTERLGMIPDEPGRLDEVLRRHAARFDLLLVTGSSSAGERDFLIDALTKTGRIDFHGVDVKPGKPLLLGHVGATPVIGLAGNPASCTMMTYALIVPALRRAQHLPLRWAPPVSARLGADVTSPRGKRHFLPVKITDGVARNAYKESDATTSLALADGYVEIPEETELLPAGANVLVHPF